MEIKTAVKNIHGLNGTAQSFWLASTPGTDYPVLDGRLSVDVVVIGGGFAGIITAYFLKEAGMTVALVEGRRILEGVTGNTTAKVTSLHRLIYHKLITRHGLEKAKQFADSNQAAIDNIEDIVTKRGIDCDFSRLPFYTYAASEHSEMLVEQEVNAAQRLGLPALFKPYVELPFKTRGAVCFENQARFHPRKFLLSIAGSIPGNGSYIFENSRVHDIEYGDICTVMTDKGEIKAPDVVVATNFPVFDKEGLYFARIQQERAYAVACRIKQPFPHGMFIDADDYKGYAWRTQNTDEGDLVIISGCDHVAGKAGDLKENYRVLQTVAEQNFTGSSIEYSWSTQDGISYDGAPFIGPLTPLHNNVYVAAGFGKWGMTLSVVAGTIITDMIRGLVNPWAGVYNPLRISADAASAKKLITENTNAVQKYVTGRLGRLPDISALAPGDGGMVKESNKRIGAYKDEQGKIFRVSPVCTHLGCIVNWNNAERTWDCPCHGSRYTFDGDVLQSPTVKPITLKDKSE